MDAELKARVATQGADHDTKDAQESYRPDEAAHHYGLRNRPPDGLALYFCCGGGSQKVRNIKRNRKVSATIDHDYDDWKKIRGLSLGGTAHIVVNHNELQHALKQLSHKWGMAKLSEEDMRGMAIVKITPKVISVLDYTKGFGHTDLVTC